MTKEKEEQPCVLVGVMLSGDEDQIVVDVGGSRAALTIDAASILFNQLGDLLEQFGYFDGDDVTLVEVLPCAKLH